MRFSAITAVCVAPLALAGTLQADLIARDVVGIEASSLEVGPNGKEGNGLSRNQNNNNNQNQRNGNNNNDQSITEVVIIWVNNGGNAATTTLTTTQTVFAQSSAAAVNGGAASVVSSAVGAVATHMVSWARNEGKVEN